MNEKRPISFVQGDAVVQSATAEVDPVDETLVVVERAGRVVDWLVVDDRIEQHAQSDVGLQFVGHQIVEPAAAAATVAVAIHHH